LLFQPISIKLCSNILAKYADFTIIAYIPLILY
jgi:hypothetical protein